MVKPAGPVVMVPRRWEPREYQKPLMRYLEGGGTRADVVAHRRWAAD
jgi:phage terminase large subunit